MKHMLLRVLDWLLSRSFRLPGVLLMAALVAGCDTAPRRDPAFAASLPAPPAPGRQEITGAIFQAGHEIILFEDIKARRVGDLITIKLVEKTNATKTAQTTTSKDSSNEMENPKIFGANPLFALPGALPLGAAAAGNNLATSLGAKNAFTGKGDSKQSNSLSGDITVTVAEVFPNGNLYVRGEKRLGLNQGNEYIRIAGIVRPADIGSDNSVLSTRIADATITYAGDGHVAESNRVGWLSRFFSSPFFPF
jgi:flagellar L-ring protein precursor FlgH